MLTRTPARRAVTREHHLHVLFREAANASGYRGRPRRHRWSDRRLAFITERETKNTVRFQEEASGKPPVIGTLYVQRWALGEPLPQRLTVTIEAASA